MPVVPLPSSKIAAPDASTRTAWWQWPTVLSLDAPAVALVWQVFFARLAGVHLQSHHLGLLGMVTWVVYAADRWMEGLEIDPDRVCTRRHRFYQQHRRPVAALCAGLTVAGTALAMIHLTRAEWRAGLSLAAPVALYLVAGPLLRRIEAWRIPKELCIAVLFAAGTGCFPFVLAGPEAGRIVLPVTWFALLCFVNLVLIARWETAVDVAHAQFSIALAHPALDRTLSASPWLLALLAAGAAFLDTGGPVAVTACVAVSALLLGLLDRWQDRLGRQRARAVVDATLLTPLVLLSIGWI